LDVKFGQADFREFEEGVIIRLTAESESPMNWNARFCALYGIKKAPWCVNVSR
jgi:hypothetical protein